MVALSRFRAKARQHGNGMVGMASTHNDNDRQRSFDEDRQQTHAAPAPALTIQKKLSVGASDDRYEREADAVAAQVVQRLSSGGRIGASTGEATGEATAETTGRTARRSGAVAPLLGSIQRLTNATAVGLDGGDLDEDTSERVERSRGGGSAMPAPLRRSMEEAFGGVDFGGVRLHSGSESKQLNNQMSARAFTVGSDIYFNEAMPSASSSSGQSLLAHELTHTLQQGGAGRRNLQRKDLPDLSKAQADFGTQGEKTGGHEKANDVMESLQGGTGAIGEFGSANSYRTDQQTAATGKDINTTGLAGDDVQQGQITMAAGGLSTFDLILDISKAVKVFTDTEAKAMEKVGAGMSLASSGTKTAAGMSSITKTAQGSDKGSTTDIADKVLGEIAGFISIFQGGYNMVKSIYELVSKGAEMSDPEKAAGVGELVKAILETGKGTVELCNKFMSHLSTVSGPALAAVPGIGIAINCIDMIMNGINIGYAFCAFIEMKDDKRTFKPPGRESLLSSNKSYKKTAQGLIDNSGSIDTELADATTALTNAAALVTSSGRKAHQLDKKLKALKLEKKTLEAKKPKTKDDTTRLGLLPGLITTKTRQLTGARTKETAHTTSHGSLTAQVDEKNAVKTKAVEAKNYMLAKNLQEIAAKRIKRGALNIGLTLPAIAGDIAILSGAGAAVGAGLKVGSGGGKMLAVSVRMAKQAYHNSKGDDKSETSKLALYDRLIKGMTDNVINSAGNPTKEKSATRQVIASGLSIHVMTANKDKGPELYEEWIKALKKR